MELDEDKKIPYQIHYEHHVWTERKMTEEEKWKDRWATFWMGLFKAFITAAVFVILGLAVYGWQVQQFDKYTELVEKKASQ